MDYKSLIEEAKSKIDNYSFDSSIYDEIYEKAYERLAAAYDNSYNALDTRLSNDRRQAIGSNALQTRSLAEQLFARGLDNSGESGLLRINQAVSLNNALASLEAAAIEAQAELDKEKNLNAFNLEKDINDMKNTAMQADRNRLYDRLSHLEKLESDASQYYSGLAQDDRHFNDQLDFEKQKFKKEFGFKKKELLKESIANINKLIENTAGFFKNKGDAEKGNGGSGNKIDALSNEDYQAILEAGMDVIAVKTDTVYEDPDVDAKTLAKNIVDSDPICNGHGIYTAVGQDSVYKTLGKLVATNKFSNEYINEMVNYLQSFGFSRYFNTEFLNSNRCHTVFNKYSELEEAYYRSMVSAGKDQYSAMESAKIKAGNDIKTLYKKYNFTADEITIVKEILGI